MYRWVGAASSPVALEFSGAGDRYARVKVTPVQKLAAGTYQADALTRSAAAKNSRNRSIRCRLCPRRCGASPRNAWCTRSTSTCRRILRVGYITAENEPVPEALRATRHSRRNAGCGGAGVRRFVPLQRHRRRRARVRIALRSSRTRTSDCWTTYRTAARWIVQYERDFAWDRAQYAPYPAKIGGGSILPRITDETSPVKFLKPDDPLLNQPEQNHPGRFQGLGAGTRPLFLDAIRSQVHAAAGMNDPGEAEQNGVAGLHEVRQRHLHLHRPRVLPATAGRRARRIPIVRESAQRIRSLAAPADIRTRCRRRCSCEPAPLPPRTPPQSPDLRAESACYSFRETFSANRRRRE